MMKRPLAILAVVALLLAALVEAGSAATRALGVTRDAPGIAIIALVAIDIALLLRFALTTFGTLVSGSLQGKIDGLATLIAGILLVLFGITTALAALALLMLMVGLVLAPPFGTAFYMVAFGSFATGAASTLLSLAMLLKLGGMAAFVAWNIHVLCSKSTVLLALTSLLLSAVVSLLHGLVPRFLVSITDAIAAIIIGIVCIVWGIVLAIFGVPAVVRAARTLVPARSH
jgi:hypothetical protein